MRFLDKSFKTFISSNGLFILAFGLAIVILISVGPVMRESDQASILNGAIQLGRDWNWFERSFYSYDKHWVVYTLLAPVFSLSNLTEIEANPSKVVLVGNYLGAIIFVCGLLTASLRLKFKGLGQVLPWLLGLFSPCVLLSSPLLSSNIIAAGFCLILYALLTFKKSLWQLISLLIFSVACVGSRIDFALIMPLICWGIAGYSWRSLFIDQRCWALFIGSVSAICIGQLLVKEPHGFYEPFTNIKAISGFLVFGLGMALPFFLILFVFQVGSFLRKRQYSQRFIELFGAIALILPFLFYALQLFSPRHLVVVALGLMSLSVLPRGVELSEKISKFPLYFLYIFLFLSLFVGVNFSDKKLPLPSVTNISEYATADGYWPMGGAVLFLARLGNAAEKPIDHNQKTWGALVQINDPKERDIFRTSLASMSKLRFRILENPSDRFFTVNLANSQMLIDEVSLRRMFGGDRNAKFFLKERNTTVSGAYFRRIAEYQDIAILEYSDESNDEKLALRLAVADFFKGNDYQVDTSLETTQRRTVIFSNEQFALLVGGEKFTSRSFTGNSKITVEAVFFEDGLSFEPNIISSSEAQCFFRAKQTLPNATSVNQ